jgi:Undecaprenyl-phosphate glucose phosphotransferase
MSHTTLTGINPGSAIAATAVSLQVPRLADLRLFDKSSLISPVVVRGCLRFAELAIVALVGLLIAKLYVRGEDVDGTAAYPLAVIAAGLVTVALFGALKLYAPTVLASPLRHLPRLALGWTSAMATLVAAAFFLKIGPDYSRVWLALWFAGAGSALVAGRAAMGLLARRWARQGRLNRRAAIYGGGASCERLIAQLEADAESDIRIAGIFDERGAARVPSRVAGYPNLGGLDDLVAFSRKTRLDLVILAVPAAAETRILHLLKRMIVMPVDIRLSTTAATLKLRPRAYSRIGNVPMLDLLDKPIADWGTVAKWTLDKAVSLTALVLLAPLMALVALAIRLESRGPVLFRQKRYGFNNELIEIYKFRSMYTGMADAEASRLVTRDDPRVTRVGRFIRRTSLDELPQLFNVVRGDLSLVGPRPHALKAKAVGRCYDDAVEDYFVRHKVKPGITGWAQINGWRGETDTQEKIEKRVEHDLYYIDNWTIFLDLYILARTPFALLATENAY